MDTGSFGDTLAPAGAGVWSWDRLTGSVIWDRGVEQLFGLAPGSFEGTFEAWTARIHPDDVLPVLEKLEKAVETGGAILFDHRCVWPDGSTHWLECRGGLLFDEGGEVVGAIGVSLDIDYRRLTEEERRTLLESERAARRSLESAWERLAQLHVVAVRVAAAAGMHEVAQVMVNQGAAAVRADGGFFSLVDHSSGQVVLQASEGARSDVVDYYRVISLEDDTPAAMVARSGEPIIVTSHEDRQRRFPEMADQGAAAFVIYPIAVEGTVLAVLAFGYREPRQFSPEEEEIVQTLVGLSSQAVQRARLHDATRAAADRSTLLESVIGRLAGATTAQEVADIVVEDLIPAVGAHKGSLFLVDENSLRGLALRGYSPATIEAAGVLPLEGDSLHADAVRSRAPVLVTRDEFPERYPDVARSFDSSEAADTTAAFPLLVEGQVLGTMGLGFGDDRTLDAEEMRHLTITAGICAHALGRAKALEESQMVSSRLRSIDQITDAALSRLSLTDLFNELPARIAAAIGCDAVRLTLVDETGEFLEVKGHYGIPAERLTRVPVGRGLSGTIAALGQARVIEDISQVEVVGPPFPDHVTSEAGVPLRLGDRVIGVLDVGSGPQRPLTQADLDLLEIAADRIATAIERSRAYELERAQRARSELIGRLGEVINEPGPLGEQMERMADILCESLSHACILTVVSDLGRPMSACGHRDPEQRKVVRAALAALNRDDDQLDELLRATRTPRSHIYQADDPERGGMDRRLRHLVEQLELGSVITVPLVGASGPIGRAILGRKRDEEPFAPEDSTVFEDLAARIGAAIDGRMTFERHRSTAVTLQQSLLPAELPDIEGLDVAARYWPASESFEVGGDFYDLIDLGPGRWGVMVGDVSGKGVGAAAMTGIARHTARAAARHGVDPAGVLQWVHEAFMDQAESNETFCTAVFGILEREGDEFVFRFAVGGHPLPVVRTHAGDSHFVGEPGTVLGLIAPIQLTESVVRLEPDDWMVIYTDGVTDVPVTNAISEQELIEIVRDTTRRSAREAMASLDVVLRSRYGHYRNRDDTAVLVLRCLTPDRRNTRDDLTRPGVAD